MLWPLDWVHCKGRERQEGAVSGEELQELPGFGFC